MDAGADQDALCEQYLAALASRLVPPSGPLPVGWRKLPRAALKEAIAGSLVKFLRDGVRLPQGARWDEESVAKRMCIALQKAAIAVFDKRACEILEEEGFVEETFKMLCDSRARAPHAALQEAVTQALELLRAGCVGRASFRRRLLNLPPDDLRSMIAAASWPGPWAAGRAVAVGELFDIVMQTALLLMVQRLSPLVTGDTLSSAARAAARLLQEEQPVGWKAAVKLLSGLGVLWSTSLTRRDGDTELAETFVAAAAAECRPRSTFARRLMAMARGSVSGPWTPEEGRFLAGAALDSVGFILDHPSGADIAVRGGCIGTLRDLMQSGTDLSRKAATAMMALSGEKQTQHGIPWLLRSGALSLLASLMDSSPGGFDPELGGPLLPPVPPRLRSHPPPGPPPPLRLRLSAPSAAQAGGPEAAARLLASYFRGALRSSPRGSDGEVNASYLGGLWAGQKPEFAAAFVKEGLLPQLAARWAPDAGPNLPFLVAVLCRQDPAGVRAAFEGAPGRAAAERALQGYWDSPEPSRSDGFAGLRGELRSAWRAAMAAGGAGEAAAPPFCPFAAVEAELEVDMDAWLDWRRSGFMERWAAASADPPPTDGSGTCGACGADGARHVCGACRRTRYCSQSCQRATWALHKAECREAAGQAAGAPGAG